jgi:hypothetical protein
LKGCKATLKDTIQLEDYEDEGILPITVIKEAFVTLDLDIDEDLLDYMMLIVY